MKFEDIERQSFEHFGEITVFQAAPEEIDLVANDVGPLVRDHEQVDEAQIIDTATHVEVKTAFSWAGFAGSLAALVWIAGAIGGPLSYYGVDAVMTMDPAMQAGLIALAFGPALLFWLTAAGAGEALKARRLAVDLTRMAHEARTPTEIGQAQAQKLTLTVKAEIENLNDAVATALGRLAELEAVAQRNTSLFDNAIAATRENATYMAGHLARERDALVELNGEMRGQAETMAQSFGRQIRLMREASKLVKTEISAAEDALETHLTSFAASANVMAERTSSFRHVAADAAGAATSLNATLSEMLDGLGEATRLTDTARQSSEQAVLAANETANAMRETTRHAVFEAKRAAQFIRAETVALQDAATATLEKLHAAAQAARQASEESQAAADRHSASIEKRLAALASTASAKRPAPAPQPQAQPQRPTELKPTPAPVAASPLYVAAANAVAARTGTHAQARIETVEPRQARGFANSFKGIGGWGNFLPQSKDGAELPKAANTPEAADAFELVDFGDRKDPDAVLKSGAIDLVTTAGIDLDNVLQPSDLELIAQQSRNGAVARRRAVADAAPAAVGRIARYVKRNSDAHVVAAEFRARPDLAKSDNKGEGKDLVRAYLLIDAALA